jgi:hypothetical protein
VRPWAWPRVTRPGTEVRISWAGTTPPPTYVFDVRLEQAGLPVVHGRRRPRTEVVERTWLARGLVSFVGILGPAAYPGTPFSDARPFPGAAINPAWPPAPPRRSSAPIGAHSVTTRERAKHPGHVIALTD